MDLNCMSAFQMQKLWFSRAFSDQSYSFSSPEYLDAFWWNKVLLTWNLQLWRGYGRQLVFGVLDKSHSRNKIFHFYFFFFPPLYLPFDALEMPRESEKKCFLFHIAQLLHCWRKNILNINTALGLKAFLKRHFNAMTFSKVNSHKNQVKDQNPFRW